MKPIESEEQVGVPSMVSWPPTNPTPFICVTIADRNKPEDERQLFHMDWVARGDSTGEFRAKVGEALSKILGGENG